MWNAYRPGNIVANIFHPGLNIPVIRAARLREEARRLNIILLKDDPSLGQVLQVGGDDGGVVPGDIIVPKVIGYYQDYVGVRDFSS